MCYTSGYVEKNYLQSIKILSVPLYQQENHLDKEELNFSFENTNMYRFRHCCIQHILIKKYK